MSDKVTRSMDDTNLNNQTAIKEVQHLLNNGTVELTPDIVNKLRSKYSDDSVVDSIMEFFTDRRHKIVKVANIFINAFQRKYKNNFETMSLSKFMKKALKYKKRYELSDEEFDEIKRSFESAIYNSTIQPTNNITFPNTNLSRVLGYPITESTDRIVPTNTDDWTYLQDIIRMYATFRSIHSYIVIQTMTYEDMAVEAMSGKFEMNKHDVNKYVHPVIAALFLPKIVQLEERMLYANIAGIINTRYNGQRIITKPDYELFYSMVVDPSDTVCDSVSAIRDIKNRAEVQIQLWNNVYNLRNGKYYEASALEFIQYIDKCKISNYDNPDLLYLSDEGVILRRLFSVFSFRPIIVSTQPILGIISNNPLGLPVNIGSITSIPYITYKLPTIMVKDQDYNLEDANNQIQFYMENGTFVPKATQILECHGPLIFYVPRRSTALPVNINPQSPFAFSTLLDSTHHYNNVNAIQINYDQKYVIKTNQPSPTGNEKYYYLRSVVAYDKFNNTNIILGHMTFLFSYMQDSDKSIISDIPSNTRIYLPRQAILQANTGNPFQDAGTESQIKNAISMSGTIFVYVSNNK